MCSMRNFAHWSQSQCSQLRTDVGNKRFFAKKTKCKLMKDERHNTNSSFLLILSASNPVSPFMSTDFISCSGQIPEKNSFIAADVNKSPYFDAKTVKFSFIPSFKLSHVHYLHVLWSRTTNEPINQSIKNQKYQKKWKKREKMPAKLFFGYVFLFFSVFLSIHIAFINRYV